MKTCGYCKIGIIGNQEVCPACGHQLLQKRHIYLLGVLGAAIVLAFVGIALNNSDNTSPAPPTPSPAPASPVAPPIPPKPPTVAEQIAARKDFADSIDQNLLDMGIESKTYTQGPQAKTLVIQDVLASRVNARVLGNNSVLFDQMKALGFTKLRYTDGFEDSDMHVGFTWDLTK
jgi:hypothetical protein